MRGETDGVPEVLGGAHFQQGAGAREGWTDSHRACEDLGAEVWEEESLLVESRRGGVFAKAS